MATVSFSNTSSYGGLAKYSETDNTSGAWDRCHDADGTSAGTGTTASAGWSEGESWDRWLSRGFLGFDTSSLADDAVITDAYIKITGTEYYRNVAHDFVIGSGSQGSTIATSDYQDHVTTTNYSTWSHISSGSGTGTNSFTNTQLDLNATGRSSISKTGYSTFYLLSSYQ